MRIYKDLEMVEQLGSGIPRILQSYSKDNFKFTANFVRMSFKSVEPVYGDGTKGGAIGGAIDNLTDRQKEIINLIIGDNLISYRTIANKLGINESAVIKHLKKLKDDKAISRIGGTRGYWTLAIKPSEPTNINIDEGGAIGGAIDDLTDKQKEVLTLIIEDSKISYRAIADRLGINDSAVLKHLNKLKGKQVIKRIGGTRGHWEVSNT